MRAKNPCGSGYYAGGALRCDKRVARNAFFRSAGHGSHGRAKVGCRAVMQEALNTPRAPSTVTGAAGERDGRPASVGAGTDSQDRMDLPRKWFRREWLMCT
jgi:hypothetical protein